MADDDKKDHDAPAAEEEKRETKEEHVPENIRPGDYVVRVHVVEARDLKGRGIGDMSDPVVVVDTMEQKQHTATHKANLNPVFDQVLYWEFSKLSIAQVEMGKIEVSVYDANSIRRDELIGRYEFDVASVYHKKHHEVYRQWVALTDVTDEHEGIQGYLKLSITVLGPGDEQRVHKDDEDDEDDGSMMQVLMPPHIEQKAMLMRVLCYEVDEVIKMDAGVLGGTVDPYVKVVMAGTTMKCEHRKGQSVPLLQEIQVPVMEPLMSGHVLLSLYDHDMGSSDDRISTKSLSYDDIKTNGFGPLWLNFYGAHQGQQRNAASKMNRGYLPGLESTFRGRFLVEIKVEEKEDPDTDCFRIDNVAPDRKPEEIEWLIRLDVYEGSEVPKKDHLQMELSIGSHTFLTKSNEPEHGRVSWYQQVSDNGDPIKLKYPADPKQVPRVYLYVRTEDHRLAFTFFEFEDIVAKGWDQPPAWYVFKEDLSVDYLGDAFPGSYLFSLTAGPADNAPAITTITRPLLMEADELAAAIDIRRASTVIPPADTKPEETKESFEVPKHKEPVSTAGSLTVEIVKASDLPAMDRGGSSDPFVKVKVNNKKFKTKTIKNSLNPEWNESFHWDDVSINSMVELKVKDEDFGGDDTIGVLSIPLRTEQAKSGADPGTDFSHEDWFSITNKKNQTARILVKFTFKFVGAEKAKEIEKAIASNANKRQSIFDKIVHKTEVAQHKDSVLGQPVYQQFQLRAHIYQARALPAADSSGLVDPYVVVRLAGRTEKTKKIKGTVNPVWYTSMSMPVTIPTPFWLSPKIQCAVYDWDRMSKDDFLGRFEVNLLDVMKHANDDQMTPQWYPLVDWNNEEVGDAKVLAAFELVEASDIGQDLPDITPETEDKWIQITTLGLRDLNSVLGVHKTQVEFHMPSRKIFKTNKSMRPSATNPNFLQVVKVPYSIPKDPLFAPVIDLKVRDKLMGGIVSRIIAVGSFDLKKYMEESSKNPFQVDLDKLTSKLLQSQVAGALRQLGVGKNAPDEEEKKSGPPGSGLGSSSGAQQPEHSVSRASMDEDDDQESVPLLPSKSSDHVIDIKEDQGFGLGQQPTGSGMSVKGYEAVAADDISAYEQPDLPEDEEQPLYMRDRATVDNELEDVLPLSPFHRLPLYSGTKGRNAGMFKGIVQLADARKAPTPFNNNELLCPSLYIVRLYVLKATSLIPMDAGASSDPYLVVKLGDEERSTRSRYIPNTLEPGFWEVFDLPCTLPGDSTLTISVWDWDGIGDDHIGSTKIDVEDRFFSPLWRKLESKPVEWRTLHSATSSKSQGKISLWLEVMDPLTAKRTPILDIVPPPPDEYEMRVVVWGVRDVPIKDTITNQNDLYVTCECEASTAKTKRQKTDTHLRSKNGLGNFNWRMKFPVMLPPPDKNWPRLRFQIWDKDFFSANDSICEANISMKGLCKRALRKQDRVKILKLGSGDHFWLENLKHPNDTEPGKARMELSIELMPKTLAEELSAGPGRSDPNQNPFLPEPEGRVHWRLTAPLEMLKEILGPELYGKVKFWFLTICVCVFLYMTAPFISGVFTIVHDIF